MSNNILERLIESMPLCRLAVIQSNGERHRKKKKKNDAS